MKLGHETTLKFFVMAGVGMIICVASLLLSILPGSVYGFDQPGFDWLAAHVGSGLLLTLSGIVGAVAAQLHEGTIARYRKQVPLMVLVHVVALGFFVWFGYYTYENLSEPSEPIRSGAEQADEVAVAVFGSIIVMLAIITFVVSTHHLLRVWRIHRLSR